MLRLGGMLWVGRMLRMWRMFGAILLGHVVLLGSLALALVPPLLPVGLAPLLWARPLRQVIAVVPLRGPWFPRMRHLLHSFRGPDSPQVLAPSIGQICR